MDEARQGFELSRFFTCQRLKGTAMLGRDVGNNSDDRQPLGLSEPPEPFQTSSYIRHSVGNLVAG